MIIKSGFIALLLLMVSNNSFAFYNYKVYNYKESGNIGCVDVLNIFNMIDYEQPIILKSPKGYEKILRQAFEKEFLLIFEEYLSRVNKVDYRFVDKMCFDLHNILNEEDYTIKEKKLEIFSKRLISNFKHKIGQAKLNYQIINGCEKYASSYASSLIGISRENFVYNTVAKRQYLKCVSIYEKRL